MPLLLAQCDNKDTQQHLLTPLLPSVREQPSFLSVICKQINSFPTPQHSQPTLSPSGVEVQVPLFREFIFQPAHQPSWVCLGPLSLYSTQKEMPLLSGLYLKHNMGLPWWLSGQGSACLFRRHRFNPWGGKSPWRRKWQPTPVFLPGESHGQRSLVGCRQQGCKESEITEPQEGRRYLRFHIHGGSLQITSSIRVGGWGMWFYVGINK